MKGNRLPSELDINLVKTMQGNIRVMLVKLGEKVTDKHLAIARDRIAYFIPDFPTKQERIDYSKLGNLQYHQWLDDGGNLSSRD